MYAVLMILLLAAVIFVYVKRSTSPEIMTPLLYGLVAVVIVLSIGRLFRTSRPAARMQAAVAIQESFEQASAYMLGTAVAEDLPEGSTLLVIHGGQDQPLMKERVDAMVKAFREGLGRKQMTLHLDGPVFSMEEDEEMFIEEIFLSGVELQRLLQQHAGVDAVVSMIGPPFYRRPPPPGTVPPIYVMGGGGDPEGDIEVALQRGLVHAGVAFRDDEGVDWAAAPRRGMSHEDVFNLRFRIRRAAR